MAKTKNAVSKENKMRRGAEQKANTLSARKRPLLIKCAAWTAVLLVAIVIAGLIGVYGIVDYSELVNTIAVAVFLGMIFWFALDAWTKYGELNKQIKMLHARANMDKD